MRRHIINLINAIIIAIFITALLAFVGIYLGEYTDKQYIIYTDGNKTVQTRSGECAAGYYFVSHTGSQVYSSDGSPVTCEYKIVEGKDLKDFNLSYYIEVTKEKF